MLSDKKLIVTGATGNIAAPIIERLARHNEVWAAARFADPDQRRRLAGLGVRTVVLELGSGDGLAELPTDADHLLHFGASLDDSTDFDRAIRINAEGTGLLLRHCRKVRSALVASTGSIYRPVDDPQHAYREVDALGEANTVGMPTYSVSKIAQEGVARTAARLYDLPVTLARIVIAYGDVGGLPAHHARAILAGQPVYLRHDPNLYNPIHVADMVEHLEALLAAASVPATVVNWGGDEVVSAQQWCAYFGELAGRVPDVVLRRQPGTSPGVVLDVTRRRAITGPCATTWRTGMGDLFNRIAAESQS